MYELFSLKNHLRVVVEELDYVNSISVGLWIGNGSRNEYKENNGISHFIEHMLFKGTKNRTAKQIAECIEDVGGQINAFTGKESTCYYIKVLDTYMELALDVLSDMLFNSKFSEEDIEKEKGVIIEEINMSEDSPEDVLSDLHSYAIWGDDSISLPILGTIDNVKSFNREQIIKYISEYYIPENSVISIAGNVNIDLIKTLVKKYFGNWNSCSKVITQYSTPTILNNHLFKKKKLEQLHIGLGIPGIGIGDEELYSLILLSNVLGGGASSILFQKMREEKGICYSIYSYISAFNKTGIITVYVSLNPSYAIEAVSIIKNEIHKFASTGISTEKVEKAKEQLKGNYLLGLESTSSRMFNNGRSVLFLNKIKTPQEIIKNINRIDSSMLENVVNKTFKKGICNSAFVGETVDLDTLINIVEKEMVPFSIAKTDSMYI